MDETEGPIPRITAEEIRKQLEKLKNRKANSPDNLPIELWKLVGDAGIESLGTTMNEVMHRGMPSSWRYSEISPTYKGKGSVVECGNYIGIFNVSHDETLGTYNREEDKRASGIREYPVRILKRNVHNRTNICTENMAGDVPRKKEGFILGMC